MSLRSRLREMSARAEREVLAAWQRHRDGELSESEFTSTAARIIARQNRRAVNLADVALARQISQVLGADVGPVGEGEDAETGEEQTSRLEGAVRSVLAATVATVAEDALPDSVRSRLGRLARAEPLARGQDMVQRALRARRMGWVRETGDDPCPLCEGLADGTVLPSSARVARHTGCSCMQRPEQLE